MNLDILNNPIAAPVSLFLTLKARVLLETCLRAKLDPAAIAEVFDAWG